MFNVKLITLLAALFLQVTDESHEQVPPRLIVKLFVSDVLVTPQRGIECVVMVRNESDQPLRLLNRVGVTQLATDAAGHQVEVPSSQDAIKPAVAADPRIAKARSHLRASPQVELRITGTFSDGYIRPPMTSESGVIGRKTIDAGAVEYFLITLPAMLFEKGEYQILAVLQQQGQVTVAGNSIVIRAE